MLCSCSRYLQEWGDEFTICGLLWIWINVLLFEHVGGCLIWVSILVLQLIAIIIIIVIIIRDILVLKYSHCRSGAMNDNDPPFVLVERSPIGKAGYIPSLYRLCNRAIPISIPPPLSQFPLSSRMIFIGRYWSFRCGMVISSGFRNR